MSDAGSGGLRFQPTSWTLIERAGDPDDAARAGALEEVLGTYAPVLRSHLIVAGRVAPDLADDLVQGFITEKVLAANLLARADRGRGRFRSFVLKSLNNYVATHYRRCAAEARAVESRDAVAETPDASAESNHRFDREWAKQILDASVTSMRNECDAKGRDDIWGVFELRVLRPALEGGEPASYEEIVRRVPSLAPWRVKPLLVTAKRMFVRCLRETVGRYAADGDAIDREIVELREILAGGGLA
jgi:DNA-directed RNA polymerase specialized sigma24 family protein